MNIRLLSLACLCLFATLAHAQPDFQKKIQTELILADDGATISLPAGNFQLVSSLSLQDKNKITIRGAGPDKTILSFKNQTEGAEGLRVTNGKNIVIENLTIQDSKGDCIKTMNVDGITFRNVRVEWTGDPKETNGSYGLYPVRCQNVNIESCTAVGASDAGIYVGQSRQIVVKNCVAWHNVAGIEIENSLDAEVFDNHAYENTGGILVFDLPDLVQKRGGNVRVFNNLVENNNFENFAPKGNIVGKVPAGTGVMILATSQVEIFKNQIINNKSLGTGVISYFVTEEPIKDSLYYPYPSQISIHDNTYSRPNAYPTRKGRMGMMFRFKLRFGKKVPDIIWDGIVDEKAATKSSPICLQNNKNAQFANIDAGNNFKNISRDMSKVTCSMAVMSKK
ncbi:MAG: hypothetical protein EAZ91_01085 [Cytophagales bacterium]|nr:MAG: hypothetical protein EAZ91_01085 [Cytophagales bacterium]